MHYRAILSVTFVLTFGQGCGGAALVDGTAVGGNVRLHGRYMPAMSDATQVMATHCQRPFRIVGGSRGDRDVEFVCVRGRGSTALAARRMDWERPLPAADP